MNPEYLEQLADEADPEHLWVLGGLMQLALSPPKRRQLDTGVALRRYASHLRPLRDALSVQRSVLITPLGPGVTKRLKSTVSCVRRTSVCRVSVRRKARGGSR